LTFFRKKKKKKIWEEMGVFCQTKPESFCNLKVQDNLGTKNKILELLHYFTTLITISFSAKSYAYFFFLQSILANDVLV
jgi:hypothetical protein